MPNENPPRESEVDLGDLMRVLVIGIAIGIFLAGVGIGGAWWWTERGQVAGNTGTQLQEQYYRGAYDVCVATAIRYAVTAGEYVPGCNSWVAGAQKNGWYEIESEGYQFEYQEQAGTP